MSAAQFTPGPWYAEKRHTVFSIETATKSIANCSHQGRAGRDGTAEANARLIASAPELYEALLLMKHSYTIGTPSFENNDAGKAHKLADAALAKARGEAL